MEKNFFQVFFRNAVTKKERDVLSVNPISFCGRMVRPTICVIKKSTQQVIKTYEATQDMFVRSYDDRIEKLKSEAISDDDSEIQDIQKNREFAIQFDHLMFFDPEIKEIVDSLPDYIELEVDSYLQTETKENGKTEIVSPMIRVPFEQIVQTKQGARLYNHKQSEQDIDYISKIKLASKAHKTHDIESYRARAKNSCKRALYDKMYFKPEYDENGPDRQKIIDWLKALQSFCKE